MTDTKTRTETTRDSGTIPKGFDLGKLITWARGNPWVLVALAAGGGTGTQQVLAELGQKVEWWWVALGVVGVGVLNYFTESAKRQERLATKLDRMADALTGIQADLKVGALKFEHIEADVASLRQWRHEITAETLKKSRPKSKPSMRAYPGEAGE